MGIFSDRFIYDYNGHIVEVEGYYENISNGKLKFRLFVDNDVADDIYLNFGTATLRATVKNSSKNTSIVIVVSVRQYLWASAYIVENKKKIKMERAH